MLKIQGYMYLNSERTLRKYKKPKLTTSVYRVKQEAIEHLAGMVNEN